MPSHRFYMCLLCHYQVHLCSHCDRGNLYCSKKCSNSVRKRNLKLSSKRYQKTFKGKLNNAKRQATHRLKKRSQIKSITKKVTHQGSPIMVNNDLLQSVEIKTKTDKFAQTKGVIKCHFCHKEIGDYLRFDFYKGRKPIESKIIGSDFKPP